MKPNENNCNSCFESISKQKINFKNCLLVIGRWLYIMFTSRSQVKNSVPRIINSIVRVNQKTRPNRHYPRVSYKPRKKWANLKQK